MPFEIKQILSEHYSSSTITLENSQKAKLTEHHVIRVQMS